MGLRQTQLFIVGQRLKAVIIGQMSGRRATNERNEKEKGKLKGHNWGRLLNNLIGGIPNDYCLKIKLSICY